MPGGERREGREKLGQCCVVFIEGVLFCAADLLWSVLLYYAVPGAGYSTIPSPTPPPNYNLTVGLDKKSTRKSKIILSVINDPIAWPGACVMLWLKSLK